MVKNRAFSLYDVEQFLREAGAERINEKAVISLERELQDMVNEIVDEAAVYANYAGRKRVINASDIELARNGKANGSHIRYRGRSMRRKRMGKGQSRNTDGPKLMLINNIPVIKDQ